MSSDTCRICAGCAGSDLGDYSSGSEWSCSDENCSMKTWDSVSEASWYSDDSQSYSDTDDNDDYLTESEHECTYEGEPVGDEDGGSQDQMFREIEEGIAECVTKFQKTIVTDGESQDFQDLLANKDPPRNQQRSSDTNAYTQIEDDVVKKGAKVVMAAAAARRGHTKSKPTKRGPHYHKRGYRNRRSAGHGPGQGSKKSRPKRHTGMWITHIQMPSGGTSAISNPKGDKNWKCGTKSKLVKLNPAGKMGRKEYGIVAKEMIKTKRDHPSFGKFKKYNIIKIEKLVNPCLWKRYRNRRRDVITEFGKANERMMFHGSKHIDELVAEGFDERHSNPKGMFGAGIYFAIHSSKSNQYVFGLNGGTGCAAHKDKNCDKCIRKILLCRVIQGNIKQLTAAAALANPPPKFHSVEALPTPGVLQYQENVVYRGEQVYPEFLISYKVIK